MRTSNVSRFTRSNTRSNTRTNNKNEDSGLFMDQRKDLETKILSGKISTFGVEVNSKQKYFHKPEGSRTSYVIVWNTYFKKIDTIYPYVYPVTDLTNKHLVGHLKGYVGYSPNQKLVPTTE